MYRGFYASGDGTIKSATEAPAASAKALGFSGGALLSFPHGHGFVVASRLLGRGLTLVDGPFVSPVGIIR